MLATLVAAVEKDGSSAAAVEVPTYLYEDWMLLSEHWAMSSAVASSCVEEVVEIGVSSCTMHLGDRQIGPSPTKGLICYRPIVASWAQSHCCCCCNCRRRCHCLTDRTLCRHCIPTSSFRESQFDVSNLHHFDRLGDWIVLGALLIWQMQSWIHETNLTTRRLPQMSSRRKKNWTNPSCLLLLQKIGNLTSC